MHSQPAPPATSAPPGGALARAIAPDGILGGRYHLGPRVGAGGMATIFRAHDPVLERDVAVKVVHAHLAGDPQLVGRFRSEARNAAALDHPNVVHVYDAGVEDLPYIVMEYVDGPSLRDVLLQRGRLTPGEALTVVEPVAWALARAHERGLVHRDVKPENVLLSADGRAKIADFGIARTVAATSHTTTGQLIGTVHYLAPEVVDGKEASPASDQYALGILLFEAITGRKPFPAESPTAVALRHARETVPAPGSFVSDVPRPLDRVVAKATDRNPAKRYPDLGAFAEALHAAVPGGAVPLSVALDDGHEHTLIVDAAAVPTASVDAVDDVGARTDVPATAERTRGGRRLRLPSLGGLRRLIPRRRSPQRAHRPGRARHVGRTSALVVVLLGVLAAAGYSYWNYVAAPVRTVPALVGVDEADAEAQLAELGLDLAVAERVFDVEAPAGEILDQDPAADAPLRAGGEVGVTLSRGLGTAEVPDLTGATVEEAQARLDELRLGEVVVAEEPWSDTVPAGEIIAQDAGTGTELEWLTDVPVDVSRGVEQVEVPDVGGMDVEEATATLEDAKLAVETTEKFSDEVPEAGTVVSQSVAAGETVTKDTAVELAVSRGPLTFPVPDVRGQDLQAAIEELEAQGLSVEVREDQIPTLGPFRRGVPGRAEEQLPEAGASVQRGDSVVLYTFIE